jgi:hypothetical protein
MEFARMLAYVTGTVDQELLARNEYLAAENRILKAHLRSSRTPSGLRSVRSVTVWAARFSAMWQQWLSRTPFWFGTASSSPANSMVRRPVNTGLGNS